MILTTSQLKVPIFSTLCLPIIFKVDLLCVILFADLVVQIELIKSRLCCGEKFG